jgi:hypothetical protein
MVENMEPIPERPLHPLVDLEPEQPRKVWERVG